MMANQLVNIRALFKRAMLANKVAAVAAARVLEGGGGGGGGGVSPAARKIGIIAQHIEHV